eukprot:5696711-Pleurochrysis_carterae.AAC.1
MSVYSIVVGNIVACMAANTRSRSQMRAHERESASVPACAHQHPCGACVRKNVCASVAAARSKLLLSVATASISCHTASI